MEETQSHRQSPSVWGSTQDLASWDINDDEKGQGSGCKPAEKLQQTSDLCACQQRFLQVLGPIVLWIKYLFHVKI